MWSQIVLLAAAFGVGYYYASRRSGGQPGGAAAGRAQQATMAGAFPGQNNGGVVASADERGGKGRGKGRGRKKKNKGGGAAASPAEQSKEPGVQEVEAEVAEEQPLVVEEEPVEPADEPAVPEDELMIPADEPMVSEDEPAVSEDEWQAVGSRGASRTQQQSTPIPVHRSAWTNLSDTSSPSHSPTRPAPAAILRISPVTHQPARRVQQNTRASLPSSAPLTRKQRQNQRKSERLRDVRSQAAELQEQRLRQHQRDLVDVRSREQWKRAGRLEKTRPWSEQRPSRRVPQAKAAVIDGKLIWD
ncbi:hypothetical protein LPJ53_002473 [Coemansia erecta]|uniref:Uncharacterized protein n=1 Tax=Coemansia erecta TaxID=147472 RepID=A0A9W8CT01_9FUNG|nr:hypothetical protein LPJ53_002473 [Coemansia erecta]